MTFLRKPQTTRIKGPAALCNEQGRSNDFCLMVKYARHCPFSTEQSKAHACGLHKIVCSNSPFAAWSLSTSAEAMTGSPSHLDSQNSESLWEFFNQSPNGAWSATCLAISKFSRKVPCHSTSICQPHAKQAHQQANDEQQMHTRMTLAIRDEQLEGLLRLAANDHTPAASARN